MCKKPQKKGQKSAPKKTQISIFGHIYKLGKSIFTFFSITFPAQKTPQKTPILG